MTFQLEGSDQREMKQTVCDDRTAETLVLVCSKHTQARHAVQQLRHAATARQLNPQHQLAPQVTVYSHKQYTIQLSMALPPTREG